MQQDAKQSYENYQRLGQHNFEGLRKNHKTSARIFGVVVEIRSGRLANTRNMRPYLDQQSSLGKPLLPRGSIRTMAPSECWNVQRVWAIRTAHGNCFTHGQDRPVTLLLGQGGWRAGPLRVVPINWAFSDDVMSLAVSWLLCYSTLIVDNRIVRKSPKDDWVSAPLLYLLVALRYRRTQSHLSHIFNSRSEFGS
jgi:hypothetical protein